MKTYFLLPLLALTACSTPPAPAEDASTTSDLRIAFNVFTNTPEDNYEVFVMDLDGSNRKNITNTPSTLR